jgi:hypothetical protein
MCEVNAVCFSSLYLLICCVYSKTGKPTIPQAAFWTSLPGLVKGGFKFAFVDVFGLRNASASSGYQSVRRDDFKESYGTLDN